MAAVDEAVKRLPPEEALNLVLMTDSGGMRAPDEPPNWGNKVRGSGEAGGRWQTSPCPAGCPLLIPLASGC